MEKGKLPEGWEWKTINDIAEKEKNAIVDGPFGSNLLLSDYIDNGEVPVISTLNFEEGFEKEKLRFISKGKFEEISRSAIKPGDLIVAKIGSCGKCEFYPAHMPIGIIPANLLKITISKNVNKKFIYYYLKSTLFKKYLNSIIKTTSQPAFSITDFKQLPIPLPPLPVQRRIVEILDQADALRRLRAQADAETQKLLQSVFYEMFGDPVRNEKGWTLAKLKDISEEVTVGIVVRPASYYVESGIPAFRSLNVKEDALNLENLVFINPDVNDTILSKSKLRTGDILVVRTGNPGTSCVVPAEFNGANCIDLIIIRPNRVVVNSKFLSKFLNSDYGKAQSLASNTGLAQKHLNITNIRELIVTLPPLQLQEKFSHIMENLERYGKMQTISTHEIERLFDVLMKKAFNGELN